MNRLARNILKTAGLFLGLVGPYPRQLSSLSRSSALPRRPDVPSAFRPH